MWNAQHLAYDINSEQGVMMVIHMMGLCALPFDIEQIAVRRRRTWVHKRYSL